MSENKQDKPRICEVLGVEVGEKFRVVDGIYNSAEIMIQADGMATMGNGSFGCEGVAPSMLALHAVNHPKSVIRKPRFTEDEITFMRYLYGCGVREIKRSNDANDDMVVFTGKDKNDWQRFWALPSYCLPSLRFGESIVLKEVVDQ